MKILLAMGLQVMMSTVLLAQLSMMGYLVEVDKEEVWEGECFVLNASTLADTRNQENFHLYHKGAEYNDDLNRLTAAKALFHITTMSEVRPQPPKSINGLQFHSYLCLEMAICPAEPGLFEVPSISYFIIDEQEEIHTLRSKPVTVSVRPLPPGVKDSIHTKAIFEMVGDYVFRERGADEVMYNVQDTIDYSIRVSGKGIGFIVNRPQPAFKGMKILEERTMAADTIRYGALRPIRHLHYKLVFTEPGTYDLADVFTWNYFSPKEQRVKTIASSRHMIINGDFGQNQPVKEAAEVARSGILALDISNSMQVGDFKPNRLLASTTPLTALSLHPAQQPIFLVFGADAHEVKLFTSDGKLELPEMKNGTAIGNAIITALDVFKRAPEIHKTLVLVGDGDNTSGNIHPRVAALLAAEEGVTIHSIGIGKEGKVPIKDKSGVINYVEDTYRTSTLREIAELTGGGFYEYKNADHYLKVLKELFGWQ
ncbi:MAG: hypothetical protein AAGA85_22115 [Bacteroidota bacterium]